MDHSMENLHTDVRAKRVKAECLLYFLETPLSNDSNTNTSQTFARTYFLVSFYTLLSDYSNRSTQEYTL